MGDTGTGVGIAEWRAGWKSVIVASLGISLSTAHTYSQGLFMAPLEQAFGWSRADVTAGPFLYGIISGLGVLFSGVIADRFGARRVVLPGLLLCALTMALLTLNTGSIWLWYATWLLVALPVPLITPAVWTSAIVARFTVSRGLALALALAGTGLSSAVAPQIIVRLIDAYGWRAGFAFFPLLTALFIFPLALLMFDRTPRPAARQRTVTAPPLPAVGATVLSPAFLLLLSGSVVFAFGLIGIMGHFVPILTERGLERTSAAAAVGVIGMCSIGGRLVTGFLLDHFNSAVVATIAFLMPVAPVIAMINYDGSLVMAFGTSIILGLSLGAEVDIVAYLTARYFGLRRYATYLGFIQGITALAVGAGPLVGGMIHDATGRYDIMLWGLIPIFLIGTIVILALGRLPTLAEDDGAAGDDTDPATSAPPPI